MKISIVVPVYKAQDFLADCCKSVLQQSYQDYELILVDDGSPDHSGEMCDALAESFSEKCIALHTRNQGPLLARQAGIRVATGDVLVFLDSDDCIREDMLNVLADCFTATDCDMILFNASDREDYSRKTIGCPFQDIFSRKNGDMERFYDMLVNSRIPNAVWLKATKRHCFDRFPDFSSLSYVKNGEDLLMSLYMVTEAEKIVFLDKNLYFYRQHEGSIIHSYNPERARSIKMVHQELERFIDLWGMPELHPAHFSREVKGWIDTLFVLMRNKKNMTTEEYRDHLTSMAEDAYFRNAYIAMEPDLLSRKYRILADWLYHKQYCILGAAGFFGEIKQRVKHK